MYGDCIIREKVKRKKEEDARVKGGFRDKIQSFGGNIWWTIRLYTKYTLTPVIRILPSLFFRVLLYWIILSYLSDL